MEPKRSLWRMIFGIAIFFAIGFSVYQYNNRPDIVMYSETGHGSTKVIDLPDGTKVTLNELSVLSYKESPNEGKRNIDFRGEAFFVVAKDSLHPFVIKTRLANVGVFGSSFNLKANPGENDISVSVESGNVRLHPFGSAKGLNVMMGEEGLFKWESKRLFKKSENKNIHSWRTGVRKFDNQPLREVLEFLKRQFEVEILVERKEILDCPFSANLQIDELDPILENITQFYNIELETISDSTYVFKSGICSK